MSIDAWLTVVTIAVMAAALIFTRIATDLVLVGALAALLALQVLTPAEALSGLGNPGLATVGALYVVVSGLTNTGAVHAIGTHLLGRPASLLGAQVRLMLPVTAMSGFLNNTPVVAMLVPVVEDWSRRLRFPVSKLMIPLSYAAIFGGTCTLIGTSTNLIVHGMMLDATDLEPMGFFEIGALGLPAAIIGTLYLLYAGRWLLPDRQPPLLQPEGAREYALEMLVEPTSPLVGQTIESAGLRHLPGAFLAEIERSDSLLPAVAPTERLQPNDRLLFVGVVDSMADLLRLRGLMPAPDQLFKLDTPRPERNLFEVVVSERCPVVGRTIRDGQFRSRYEAVVLAVARNGKRLHGKVGDVRLRAGDTLLLEARPAFENAQRNTRDFLLVNRLRDSGVPRHDRAWIALSVLATMVAIASFGLVSMFEAALFAAALMLIFRCTSGSAARTSIDWSVLVVIGASLGIGIAMQTSGAADYIARGWLGLAGADPLLTLIAVYAMTNIFTEMLTNNAAAVLMFPIAHAAAESLGVSLEPFVAVIMVAASASFSTPIGYQTNLMVFGPGGYRYTDYLRIGLPLNLLLGAVAILLAPLVWPF